ncbi:lipopolysaccharide biosynthesis protein [Tautonia sp. JC769]|uniref:lipopolysaccharide biosynthesis protein n=1 Tax=Tautonia sp. JC769 TaxID=3232135 RepID=UPI00345AD65A
MTTQRGALKSILSGAAALSSVGVLRLAMQFLSVPILARLLSPEDYGIAAIAMPIVLFVMVITDAGISNSLIRLAEINSHVWHTCFWIMGAVGIVLAAALAASAPLVSGAFDAPQLTPILVALSSIIVLQSITLVPGSALQHQKRFAQIAGAELAAIVSSLGLAIALAYAGKGVWALIWQQVAFYSVRAALTWAFTPYRPALVFAPGAAREHLAFGWNLLCANLVSFLSRSADNLIIGRVSGPAQLGIYAMAFQFARLPYMLVTGPLQAALYPHLTQWKESKERLASAFLLATRALASVIFPPVALVAAASQPVFTLLLSEKWAAAAPVFTLLAIATATQAVRGVAVTFLMVLGRTDVQKVMSLQFSILWISGLLLTVQHGILAVSACYMGCVVAFSFWSLRNILPILGCGLFPYLKSLIQPAAVSAAAVAAYVFVERAANLGDVGLVATVATLATIALALGFLSQRGTIMRDINNIRV